MIFSKKNNYPDLVKIQKMGLLAVKIAQMYALRIDFLNEEKCQHLSQLYRTAMPLEKNIFEELFNKNASEKLRENLEKIDENYLAVASIGQVHRGKLKNGDEIVVKLIKSDFLNNFEKDVKKLRRFVKFVLFFYPTLERVADPIGVLDQIEKDTLTELDLRNEIAGMKKFEKLKNEYSKKFDLDQFCLPEFYEEYSNENVLVMKFIPGKTLDERLTEGILEYDRLLELFRLHGFFMFIAGEFHGDIHPGNIILNDEGFYFVDAANIAHVKVKFGNLLMEFFEYLGPGDFKNAAKILNKMSDKSLSGEKYDVFEKKFLELYKDFLGKTVSEESLTFKMMETVKLAVRSGMRFEKGMFSVIKSLMYLDGMVRKCNPEAILLEDVQKFVKEFKSTL